MSNNNTNEISISKTIESELSVIYDIDNDTLNMDPFDPRFFITEDNKSEMIKYFEKEIRDSFEYKSLIDTFKKVLDVKSCVFFKNYSIDNGMKLEFHHHPFTLYDYTETVLNKQIEQNNGFVYENEIEKEVSMLHYKLMVGLVPLDPTSHGQVHDGLLDIPPQLVIGMHEKFFVEYNKWIPESTKTKYQIYMDKHVDTELEYPENFKYKPTIINASNKHLLTIENIDRLMISDKISQVNNEDIARILEAKKNGGN